MKVTPELLKKYTDGQCSEKERNIVEQWLNTMDGEEEIPTPIFLEEKLWENIKRATTNTPGVKESKPKKRATWLMAASIVLLIGLGAFQLLSGPSSTVTYQTLAGEMQAITLSDGTLIRLNANSLLKAPKVFKNNSRLVSLVGEAYFEVAKDSLHPFIIETEKTKTTVLGTKFNLSAYPNENTSLTLKEGSVSFKDKNNLANGLILSPNEHCVLNNGILQKEMVFPEHYIGWTKNILYFNNETLEAIATRIGRAYGVEFDIRDPLLKNQTYRGVYHNPDLESLLDDLSFVLKFKYDIKGKQIIIY
jgi:ferric-dicitrate binding protein FerR (iron transport regulator)